MALSVWVKVGEQLQVGDAVIRFEKVGAKRIRLLVEAPQSMNICRGDFQLPRGYRIEKLINGRFLLLEPDEHGEPKKPLALFDTRAKAQEKVREISNGDS
jgi:hypothetical protein